MNDQEIEKMAQGIAEMHTLEDILTTIEKLLKSCNGALDVLNAMEKPSYLILKRAAQVKRQAQS